MGLYRFVPKKYNILHYSSKRSHVSIILYGTWTKILIGTYSYFRFKTRKARTVTKNLSHTKLKITTNIKYTTKIKGNNEIFQVAKMPVSININEGTSNHSFFRFRFKFYDGAEKLSIKLLNGIDEENPYSNY